MSYIIVWGNSGRDPHVHETDRGFLASYDNYEDAKVEAEECWEPWSKDSANHYYKYQIYEAATS